jgi:antitoxin HigA-1
MAKLLAPIHPGETIREDCLVPLGMSVNQLAKHLNITAARLNDIVPGRRGITADTALRLARYFGTTPEFWMGLQLRYDLDLARQKSLTQIRHEVKPKQRNYHQARAKAPSK